VTLVSKKRMDVPYGHKISRINDIRLRRHYCESQKKKMYLYSKTFPIQGPVSDMVPDPGSGVPSLISHSFPHLCPNVRHGSKEK
jgi:hypothetical protein